MIEALIIISGGVARFLQGNGHAGPGRWLLLIVIIGAVIYGPLSTHQDLTAPHVIAGSSLVIFAWGNVAFGYTEWGNVKHSLFRYTAPVIVGVAIWSLLIDLTMLPYILAGPALTANYYFIAEHKPLWFQRLTGKDIAAPIAGTISASVVMM